MNEEASKDTLGNLEAQEKKRVACASLKARGFKPLEPDCLQSSEERRDWKVSKKRKKLRRQGL